MKSTTKFVNLLATISVFCFIALIICEPKICTHGACQGILLCGRVIIPSLFPFTVCVLFILKSGVLSILNFTAPFTKKVFNITPELFSIMLLSFLGGYPIGAKLINELVTLKKIDAKSAGVMLNYCVNAGPAFIILAVGNGILGSKNIGYLLLASHITASFILAIICGQFLSLNTNEKTSKTTKLNAIDNFVISTSEASTATFNICGYIIFFSTLNSYIELIELNLKPIKYLKPLLEVANGISLTKNIFIISFLLGFGGFCVWCQILSLSRKIKIDYIKFIISRILHGILSILLTSILIKIFKISLPTFSNGKEFSLNFTYNNISLSISMICMVIILLISIYSKKCAGKILEDLI